MRGTIAFPLLAAIALCGCDSKGSVEARNESVDSVNRKVAETSLRPLPGRWETAMTIERMEVKGMPAGAAKSMQQGMGTKTIATCLTPEQASGADGQLFRSATPGCVYERFSMDGGKVDAVMTCKHGPQLSRTTMNGTYGEDAYAMKMTSESEIQPGMPMSMAMTLTAHRVGDCKGDEDK